MRKKSAYLLFTTLILLTSISFSINRTPDINKASYEKKVESNLQRILDRLVGKNKAIITIDIDITPKTSTTTHTNQANFTAKKTNQKSNPKYIMPGVPALKSINDTAVNIPFDYENTITNSKIKKFTVMLIFDKSLPQDKMVQSKNFIIKYLGLNTRKDKIKIFKENFIKEKKDIIIKSAINQESSFTKNNQSKMKENSPQASMPVLKLTIALAMGFLLVTILMLVMIFILAKRKNNTDNKSNDTSFQMQNTSNKPFEKQNPITKSPKEKQQTSTNEEQSYFNFINEENILKLKHILQIKIALDEASTKTIAMIVAYLPANLANKILIEYPAKIQAEIITMLMEMKQYDKNEIVELETEIKENIKTLLGGRFTIKNIVENLSSKNKKILTNTIAQKYPSMLHDIRNYIILFDDILELETKYLEKVFQDFNPNTISIALSSTNKESKNKVLKTLPEGTVAMVEQWIELKGQNISAMEVEECQEKIIEYAKKLEEDKIIKIEKLNFLNIEKH